MKLPEFLVIGAMKSATTTLFHDLQQHGGLFFPDEKEPDDLTSDALLTPAGTRKYTSLFSQASNNQLCGEASTSSTKYPKIPGVPMRARQVLGPDLKLIYVTRDPVDRLMSHHRHHFQRGEMPRDLGEAVSEFPELVDISRYHMQISQWLEFFPRQNVLVLQFEKFTAHRQQELDRICLFLGIDAFKFDTSHMANDSDSALPPRGLAGTVVKSRVYRRFLKAFLGKQLRSKMRSLLFRKSVTGTPEYSGELLDQLALRLRDDAESFARDFGLDRANWPQTLQGDHTDGPEGGGGS